MLVGSRYVAGVNRKRIVFMIPRCVAIDKGMTYGENLKLNRLAEPKGDLLAKNKLNGLSIFDLILFSTLEIKKVSICLNQNSFEHLL